MKISSHSKEYFLEITGAAFIRQLLQKPYKLAVIDKEVLDLYKDSVLKDVDMKRIYLL